MVGRGCNRRDIDEEAALAPVVYRATTGDSLPRAFWMAASVCKEVDDLAVEAVRINRQEKPGCQHHEAGQSACCNGHWFGVGKFGHVLLWISNAELEMWALLDARGREIDALTSIFRSTAPDTADAQAALAALETADLDPWTEELDDHPASYRHASHWLQEHAFGETDPSFMAFRATVRYLVNRPLTLNAALYAAEEAFA